MAPILKDPRESISIPCRQKRPTIRTRMVEWSVACTELQKAKVRQEGTLSE